jgi:flagellar basal-body rod protein FlgF
MAGGAYTALSGLRARVEQLDRLASDIANAGTAGYKAERATTVSAERPDFGRALQSAIDVAPGPGRYDFRGGSVVATGRELDVALDGPGFFAIDTPAGPRYTRNGQFDRRADGTLVTSDGFEVLGERGAIRVGTGPVRIDQDGTVHAAGTVAGRLRIVDFDDYTGFAREEGGRFRAAPGRTPVEKPQAMVRAGALEQSNVSMVERMAQLTEVGRGFEALQRGLSVLMNDVDGRAINELGRR